jgi:hypothetical protein
MRSAIGAGPLGSWPGGSRKAEKGDRSGRRVFARLWILSSIGQEVHGRGQTDRDQDPAVAGISGYERDRAGQSAGHDHDGPGYPGK